MNIEVFQKSFQIREINYKPYLIVVSIFITILLIIVLLNNKLEDYYICQGRVIDNNLSIIVSSDDLENITKNKKLKIERNIVINKTTIFDYLIKTAKGEWHIKKISKEELQKMNGGGFLGIAGIITGIVFAIGVIDGFVRPKKCTE